MKKNLLLLMVSLLVVSTSFGQLTGVKFIPGDYPTVASAIAALNASGVGSGGVTFNVVSGHTETLPSSTAGNITTLTGSIGSPITFIKLGAGTNPLITSSTGKGSMDAIISVAGCDYVTFNGIDLVDNPMNSSEEQMMEWGYAILKASASNGSHNITIRNCTVSLNVYHVNSTGIYSCNHTSVSPDPLVVTDEAGSNSRLKIFSNTINNSYSGIKLNGYNDPVAPYAYYDQQNEIGKDGGNTITNVAGVDVVAGYGVYTEYQNILKVANNSITSVMGGSGTPYGIYLSNALNASYDLYGNYVSIQFWGEGSTSFYPISCSMGASGTSNTVNAFNNTVNGCTFPTATTGYSYMFYLLNMGVTANVYGNSITNNVIGESDVSANSRVYYLFCNKQTITMGPLEVYNNLISGNSRIQVSIQGGLTQFLRINGVGTVLNLYNNTVTNNIIGSNGGTDIIYAGFENGEKNVYNNTISNISRAEGTVNCLYNYNVSSITGITKIYKNTITNIEGVTSGSTIYGFYNTANGNASYYYNNMVSDLRSLNANNSYPSLIGIYHNQGEVYFYNNTVFLNGTSGGTNFNSAAVYSFYAGHILELRNNILVNTSTPKGTGKACALRFAYTNLAAFSSLSNYNDLYAGVPSSSRLIYYDGLNSDQTLAAYQARVYPREVQSVTELPPFNEPLPFSTNVRIRPGIATQCEAGGSEVNTPVPVTDDFDGEARFPHPGYPLGAFTPNAPDIGADEFAGLSIDLAPPDIQYTPLRNTMSGAGRTLIATITDGTGVPQSGTGLPVLYWKINSGSYMAAQGSFVTGSTYSFTFGAGAALGDVVSYYVVAQDLAAIPNVIARPSLGAAGYTASPPACTTPPATPNTYTIIPGISGDFHVGVGKHYTTLTAAASDINTKALSGPVTLILDDLYYPNESYPVTFNSNPGSSAVNTLTIKPNIGISAGFNSGVMSSLIILNGIDYVVIDGSNNGTNSRDLTFENGNTSIATSAISLTNDLYLDPATNITIKNCVIKCLPVHANNGNIALRFSGTGGGYDDILIKNNTIHSSFVAIQLVGSESRSNHNCRIVNNIIGSEIQTEAVTQYGIHIVYADSTLIEGNDIMGPKQGSLNPNQAGILVDDGSTNTMIRKNKIHDFFRTEDDGWGVAGIYYEAEGTSVTEISNNQIYDIKSPGKSPGLSQLITYGIYFHKGGNFKILHNSINLTGDWLSSIYNASSACIGFNTQVSGTNIEIRNNILRNGMGCMGAPNPDGRAYGIMFGGGPALFSQLNHNDYFIDGYNGAIALQFFAGGSSFTVFPTLASWQNFTGQETNGLTLDPSFTTATNLLPTSAALNNKGQYLSLVPTDFFGLNRNNPADIGAVEFGEEPLVVTAAASAITSVSADLNGMVNPRNNFVTTWFDYGTTAAYGNTVAATPDQVSGPSNTVFSASIQGLALNTTYHYRARTVANTGLISFGSDMTFTTSNTIPENITVNEIVSGGETHCYNATNTITVAGGGNTFTVMAGGSATFIAGQKISFLPGTTVNSGGYLLGYITTNGQYCQNPANPVVANQDGGEEPESSATTYGQLGSTPGNADAQLRVYPNPVLTTVTIELKGLVEDQPARISIFNMNGIQVRELELQGNGKHDVSLAELKPAVYFIQAEVNRSLKTVKIIKF